MPYILTQADIDSIKDVDIAFSTTRFLPQEEDVPEEFRGPWKADYTSNIYVKLIDALFCGSELPNASLTFNEGFDGSAEGAKKLRNLTMAHLRSFEPKHEHKISAIAYMVSKVITLKEEKE